MNPVSRFITSLFNNLFLHFGIWLLLSSSASAILDVNENGASDIWEKHYNAGILYLSFDPSADPDGDGWSNAKEAAAGTDPGEANPPTGFIRPEIEHIPAVYLSPEENGGEPTLASPEAIQIRWPTLVGKTYTLLTSFDLSPQSWQTYGGPRIGTGSILGAEISLTQPDGSIPPAAFLRVAVEDIDIDGDTLTNAEEHAVGSSSYFADTNGNGILDEREIRFGNHPSANTADENGDGIPDNIFYSVEFEITNEHHSIPFGIGHQALSGIDNLHRYLTSKSSTEYSISGFPSYPDLANGSLVWTNTYLVGGLIPADGQGITKLDGISIFEWRNTHYLPLATDEYLDDDPTQTVVTGPTITATEIVETTTQTTTWRVKKYVAGNPEDITVRSGTETVIVTDRQKLSDSVTYQELWNNYFKEIQWPAGDAGQSYFCGPHNGMNQARSTFGDVVTAGYIRDAFRQEDFTIFGNIRYCGTSQGDYGQDGRMKSLRWRWVRFNPLTPFDYEYAAPPASYQTEFHLLVGQNKYTYNRTGELQHLSDASTKGLVEIECKGSEGAGWHTVDPSKFDAYQIEEPASLATLDFTKCGTSRVHFGKFPLEFGVSHPAVESDHPSDYTSDADLPEVRVTFSISPAADGTIIEWDIVEGDGSLSETETTTTNGFASTVLTTSTNAGDTYKVRGRVKTLLLPLAGEQTEEIAQGRLPALEKETATITVLAGFASSITVEKQTSGAPAGTSLIADGKSETTLVATIHDQYGQPVEENTPVVWHLGGLGKIIPLAEGTDSDGKIRAKLIAGNAVGQQKVRIEASGFEVTEVIENETAGTGLNAGSSSLDIATHQTTALTASFPDVADGAEVKWFSSSGEITNAATTVQSGQATATLRAGGGRIGSALVTASVGSSLLSTQVEMITSAPISVKVTHPVIVGDASADGTTTVERLDGSMQSVAYHTSTAVKIKASGFAGMPATVSLDSLNRN